MVTHGTDGDVLPFVRLGERLRSDGHEVTLISHEPYRDRCDLDFIPIDTAEEFARHQADTAHLMDTRGESSWLGFYLRNGLFEQLLLETRALTAAHRPGDTVLVGRHTSAVSVRFAAELLGAPAAWVSVSPIQVMSARLAAHMYGTELADRFTETRARLGLPPITDWQRWFAGADLDIGLWPDWFDQAGARAPARFRLTGFAVPDEADEDLPDGADEALVERPVLISGGTGRMLNPRFYRAALDGCAGRPALLVVPHEDLVPRPLPPGTTWFPRLPFRRVMPRVSAVVHHGGIGTLTRALAAGTPQVVLADGADRPDNAARLARLGLAAWLPPARWGETAAALADVLADGDLTGRVPAGLDPSAGIAGAAELIAKLSGQARRTRPELTPHQLLALRRHLSSAKRDRP
ncbi:UDP-glucoronosyl and UDP-glucosyl transferase [Acrocarpospora phusangensis]|uniref:UDP-glucoronosyl and UDP-glucosyl transferase n=2 Tax=Acrocarpospora phusangensis TaxID=1070424 RepID=A0A919QHK4_9ACTN|nr:UDP-glucoronosyl and UDP-glucosyl transferase [Acrocarpospora phusangensis]